MFRQNDKTVKKSVKEKGRWGKLMSRFKTKPKQSIDKKSKTQLKTHVKKIPTKTKLGHDRQEVKHTSEHQVRKIFRIKKENPNLSNENIANIVFLSPKYVVKVRYYLDKGLAESLKRFKKKQQKITKSKKAKIKIAKLSAKKAEQNLKKVFKVEKYPVEHQADPEYFGGVMPPHAVATPENFKIQKRKNVINRAVVAKKIAKDKQITEKIKQEEVVKKRLRERHQNPKTKPKIHYPNCPCCNPNSNTPLEEYQAEVRREALRRHEYAQKQMKLQKREKELDVREREQQPTVAERTQQGTKLCRICESNIPYSQATRSKHIFGEYYCADHEPKL